MSNGGVPFTNAQGVSGIAPYQAGGGQTGGGLWGKAGSTLGAAGAALGGGTGIAGGIIAAIRASKEGGQSRAARHIWDRAKSGVHRMMQQLFMAPWAADVRVPYTAPGTTFEFAPSAAMQNIYSGFLNRQYGLPDSVARSMVAQSLGALSPTKIGAAKSVPQIAKAARLNPNTLAKAALGTQAPGLIRQTNYLKGAGQLASFNLWRSQYLPKLIG